MGDLGIPTSAPGSARPSLSVSVIGLLVAPVMSSLDQSQRKYPEVNICNCKQAIFTSILS